MATWVCLLRAVNLGARDKVSMPALRTHLGDAGFGDVRTYLQSGNVIVSSSHRSEAQVAAAVGDVVAEHFALDVPVMVRTSAQLAAVRALNPFPALAAERRQLVAVVFHAGPVADGAGLERAVADLAEQVVVDGREVYVAYSRDVHSSRGSPELLRRYAGQDGTARNWRTVEALADLVGG